MAQPVILSKQLIAALVNGICQTQSLAGAGNLSINGTYNVGGLYAQLDTARRVSILSSGNDAGKTWTVVGLDEAGSPISENVAGANAVAVATLQNFLRITRVSLSAATAGTVQVGTNTTGSTRWYVPNHHFGPTEIALDLFVLTGLTVTPVVEFTDDSPLAPMPIYRAGYSMAPPLCIVQPITMAAAAGTGASVATITGRPPGGIRLTITAGTDPAQLTIRQSGIRN